MGDMGPLLGHKKVQKGVKMLIIDICSLFLNFSMTSSMWNIMWNHGLLESRTGNFNITVKKQKIDALIFERIDEID